ncbi:MAG TPA: ABC transporter ATP-binding protein [Gaiellaceae bacterium]|nr:ABC transporter ATP-binding protein [Gaiellaceae bacterium]
MDTLTAAFRLPLRSFDLDLTIEVARTVALVGPSGAGKTSILRAIAGLARPAEGRISLGGDVWFDSTTGTFLQPEGRRVGLVFQEYALFPHLTVRQNVAYGGKGRVDELLERLRIGALQHAKPGDLSGGERQRVALARALAREPDVLLLDEPLAALDPHTRDTVRVDLRETLRDLALPALVVTHDFVDAAALAAKVGVIVDGRLVQLGSPEQLIAAPVSPFVARFAGGNVLHGRAHRADGLTTVELADRTLVISTDDAEGEVAAIVYPWELTLARALPGDSSQNHVQAVVTSVVPVANRVRVTLGPVTAEVTAESAARLGVREGDLLIASWKATATRLVAL